MAMTADERKLLRKIIEQRASRAKARLEGAKRAATQEINRVVPAGELPATDPRRRLAEEYNAWLKATRKAVDQLEEMGVKVRTHHLTYIDLIDELPLYDGPTQKKKHAALEAEYAPKFEELENLVNDTMIQAVAGGLADTQLKEFTSKLEALTAGVK